MYSTRVAAWPIAVLLVEDNPADVELVEEALREGDVPVDVSTVGDGDEALRYLRGEGEHAGALLPDLVVLDLKVPRRCGLEVLAAMKADAMLRNIPVVVLSSSADPRDVRRAYDLRASCYINKPADLPQFRLVIRSLRDFCLTVVKLPRDGETCPAENGRRYSPLA
jgi:CheY-like chemotaxis protein